jgi:MFS family permease
VLFCISPTGFHRVRGQIMGLFYFGAPLAFIFGSPLSGLLLELDGLAGLKGWQWMFLTEGLLASVVGVGAYWYLDSKPSDARWLPPPEKQALLAAIGREEQGRSEHGPAALGPAFTNPRVLLFIAIYFLIQMSVYGIVFYLPSQVAQLLGKKVGFEVGMVTAIPWVCAIVATYVLPRAADRTGNHRMIAAATLTVSGIGIAVSAATGPILALIAPLLCGIQLHRRAADVLDISERLSKRCRSGGGDRPDQCAWCSGRLRGAEREELGGREFWLRDGWLVRPGLHDHCRSAGNRWDARTAEGSTRHTAMMYPVVWFSGDMRG